MNIFRTDVNGNNPPFFAPIQLKLKIDANLYTNANLRNIYYRNVHPQIRDFTSYRFRAAILNTYTLNAMCL